MPNWSQEQLNAHRAKEVQKDSKPNSEGCEDESELQRKIVAEVKKRGWLVLYGSMARRTHRIIGEWDMTIIGRRDLSRNPLYQDAVKSPWWVSAVWLIETKTKSGRLTKEQAALHAHARALGFTVHVIRSFEQFLNVVDAPPSSPQQIT